MNNENNVVYVETKSGIFKCYKSEQIGKPIYYPVESKTNGYIDCYDVIRILNIDDLYKQVKKQQEIIDKTKIFLKNEGQKQYNIHDNYRGKWYSPDELDILFKILEDKEVSE